MLFRAGAFPGGVGNRRLRIFLGGVRHLGFRLFLRGDGDVLLGGAFAAGWVQLLKNLALGLGVIHPAAPADGARQADLEAVEELPADGQDAVGHKGQPVDVVEVDAEL